MSTVTTSTHANRTGPSTIITISVAATSTATAPKAARSGVSDHVPGTEGRWLIAT